MAFRLTHRQCVRALLLASSITTHACADAEPAGTAEWRIAGVERNAVSWVASRLLACIYKDAGLPMRVQAVPASRAHLMALEGTVDGELIRMSNYADSTATLVRIDPPFYRISLVAYSLAARHVHIQDASDLRRYKVGSLRGLTTAQTLTSKLPDVTLVSSPEQMFQMLQRGRIDVAIETRLSGAYTLQRLHAQNLAVSPELTHFELHHYLDLRHKDSVAPLSAAIERLRNAGSLQRMTTSFERQVSRVDLDRWAETTMPEVACEASGPH